MGKTLIAYTTNSGSTTEVAQEIAAELVKKGQTVDVLRIEDIPSLDAYERVILGAPMIIGWHRAALAFIKRHKEDLAGKQVAYFCTAMSLTSLAGEQHGSAQVFVDPELAKDPAHSPRFSFKEHFTTIGHYIGPIAKAAPRVHPVSIAFFGGKLELFKLVWYQALFVTLVVGAQPGDRRNWQAIRQWAAGLPAV